MKALINAQRRFYRGIDLPSDGKPPNQFMSSRIEALLMQEGARD
jgi:hypothetical protein